MARNKYPEVTVEKILEVSKRLFLEKGYDNTTIQDIVDGLGGLTKGAIYHHFKSKEEIMDALGDHLFYENNPFAQVKLLNGLNGLQKLREVVKLVHAIPGSEELGRQSLPLFKNPRLLAKMLETDQAVIVPLWQELIEEGNRDGSLHTEYPREAAEVFQLLIGLWMMPAVYPATENELYRRVLFIKQMMEQMGVPVIDEEILAVVRRSLKGLDGA